VKVLFTIFGLIFSVSVIAQEIDIKIKEPEPYKVGQDISFEIYLRNTDTLPLSYFDSRGPSWDSFKEIWDMNANGQFLEIFPLNGKWNHNFSDSTIITIDPGDTNLIRTKTIPLVDPGQYSFTYTQEQSPKFVKKENGDNSVADSTIQKINEFKVSQNIKFTVYNSYDTLIHDTNSMTWEEWKDFRHVKLYSRKKYFDNLSKAIQNPQDVYELSLFCDGLSAHAIKRIARLKNLKALELRNYELDFFPEELVALNLYELTLVPKGEMVINFPDGLSQNNTLRELTLKLYDGFPKEILSLKELLHLDINNSNIKTLPNLEALPNLKVLIANNAKINTLDQIGFDKLPNLIELNLSGNREINDITPLFECPNLEFLVINRTKIKTIPADIEKLNKLKKLCISNSITSISDSIGNLEDIRYLSFSGNRSLDSIPQSIVKMKKLLHLELSNTKIDRLPEGIAELPLEKIQIYNTNIKKTKDYMLLKYRLKDNFKD